MFVLVVWMDLNLEICFLQNCSWLGFQHLGFLND